VAQLDELRRFALPVIEDLAALPEAALWGEWLDRLEALAPRVLRHPERVLALLTELRPMAAIGPLTLAEVREVLTIPAIRLGSVPGLETTVVAYTTDIPAFGGTWGEPFLIGPGSIHVAHTLEERVPKKQLLEAVTLYQRIVKDLCKRESK